MKVFNIKRIALSGMLALGLVAGGMAAMPTEQTSAATTKLLYTIYFNDGSGQGQQLRANCVNSAASYGAISATAQVTGHARQVNGVWQNKLDCIGTFFSRPVFERVPSSGVYLGN